jgi:hypothetical protein
VIFSVSRRSHDIFCKDGPPCDGAKKSDRPDHGYNIEFSSLEDLAEFIKREGTIEIENDYYDGVPHIQIMDHSE